MYSNSEKQDIYNSPNVHSSYQISSTPSAVYPSQPIGGTGYTAMGKPYISQIPLRQQNSIVVTPAYQQMLNNRIAIPITTSLRTFLLLSGFFYALWGIISFSVQIGIIVNSYSTYYHGFWTGAPLIVAGIVMMVVGFRSSYPLFRLMRIYSIDLIFCILGLIFSITNYTLSNPCDSKFTWLCDDSLAGNLKIALIVVYSVALIHTIFNMIYISKEQKRTVPRSNLEIHNYS